MKITKRLVALLVALSLFLAMFAPSIVSAAEFKEGTITYCRLAKSFPKISL